MIRIVFSTIDKLEHAHRLAGHLVGEKLAACVNIGPEITSVYHWQGTVEKTVENSGQDVFFLLKSWLL